MNTDSSPRTRPTVGRVGTVAVLAGALLPVAVLAVTMLAYAPAAGAIDDSEGTPGFCPGDDGVTVVVDFQQLGAETIVRCAPGSEPRTGLEVLHDAGFQIEGVQRWGEGFVCRIENRPAATEPLPVAGNDGYREACVDTPPPSAFWGYWRSDDGGEWRYSARGVKNTQVEPGGFQGWSFSLNATDHASPAPRIPPGPQTANEAAAWTGGEVSPDVRDAQQDGSAWSSVLALGAVAGVAALVAAGSVRRRRLRAGPGE